MPGVPVGGTVPATLVAVAGRAGELRRVHAGHREDVHGLDDRQRDLDRRRRARCRSPIRASNAPGRLVNGAFSLAQPLQVKATSGGSTGVGVRAARRHAADAAHLHRPGQQRHGHDRLRAVDRAPTRRCARAPTQDAHLHAEHDDAIASLVRRCSRASSGPIHSRSGCSTARSCGGACPRGSAPPTLWRDRRPLPRRGPGRGHAGGDPRPGARRAGHHHRRRDPARVLLELLRDGARGRRRRQARAGARPQRQPDAGAARRRPDHAAASRSWCATPSSCARTPTA